MSEVVYAKDIRGQTAEELSNFLRNKREELWKLRFQFSTGQLENVARLKSVRREIARAETVRSERVRSGKHD